MPPKYAKKRPARKPYKKKTRVNALANKLTALSKRIPVPEKKYINFGTLDLRVGQFESAGPTVDGIDCVELTPIIALGTAYNQRVGSAVKPTGMYVRMLVTQQTSTVNVLQYNVTIVRVKGGNQTVNEVFAGMYDPDTITGLRDYNAPRNPNHWKDYAVIFSKNYALRPDSVAGASGSMDMHVPLRLQNYTMRHDIATGAVTEGQLFIIVRAATGNYSAATNTGAIMYLSYRLSYTDV